MLTVTNIDGDNVTIKIVNEDQQKTVKFDKLNGNVMTPEEAKSKTVVETIEVTPEVKTVIDESIAASNSLSDETIDKIVTEVGNKELKDLENDLYNLEIC
jgi:hypothetical protein